MRKMQAKRDDALGTFVRGARKMRPTQRHRAGLWENMLGTVYAMSPAGEVRYFDYDYKAAVAFVGLVGDVRQARRTGAERLGATKYEGYELPRRGQTVWFVVDAKDGAL